MENKYDIRVNPPEWTEAQAEKHMNFNALMERYERAPKGSEPSLQSGAGKSVSMSKWLGIALMAAVVSLLLWLGSDFLLPADNMPAVDAAQLALADMRPMPQVEPAAQTNRIDAVAGDTLVAASGSRLIIPPAAFQDEAGQAITGEVELAYTEHSDFVEVFLSGAEMKNAAGEQLETAGLMEIQAQQNGKSVYLKADKAIQVELKAKLESRKAQLAYEVQQYHIAKAFWQTKGSVQKALDANSEEAGGAAAKESATSTAETETSLRKAIAQNFPKPSKPIAPGQKKKDSYVLELDIKAEEFPELAEYSNILWEVDNANYKEEWDKINWEDFDVVETSKGQYRLTLSTREQQVEMPVRPIILNNRKNKSQYQKELEKYEAALAQREQAIEKAFQEAKAVQPIPSRDTVDLAPTYRWVTHLFSVPQLGLWGCNRVLEATERQQRFALQMPDGKTVKTVFMATAKSNTVYRIAVDEQGQALLPITQEAQQLWALDDENRLLQLQGELPKEGEGQRLPFQQKNLSPQTEEQLRRVLAFNS